MLILGLCIGLAVAEPEVIMEPSAETIDIEGILSKAPCIHKCMKSQELSAKIDMANRLSRYTNVHFQQRDVNDEIQVPLRTEQEGVLSMGSTEDPSATMDIRTDYDIVFNKGIRKYEGNGPTPFLPGEKAAMRFAKDHLSSLGLLPAHEEYDIAHVGGVGCGTVDEYGNTTDAKKLVTVYFGRKIGGIPVVGASRMVVSLGSSGELQGLIADWTPAKPVKALKKTDFLDYKTTKGLAAKKIKNWYNKSKRVQMADAMIVYYDDGEGTIEPAVHYRGQVMFGDGSSQDEYWIMPAIKNPTAQYPLMQTPPVDPEVAPLPGH
jgi:hypothetical protein